MFRKIALELTKRSLPVFKSHQRFFSQAPLPMPHSHEHLILLEAEFKKLNIPFYKTELAQGSRLYACNTHEDQEIILDANPMFLTHDTSSILGSHDELMRKYNQYGANIMEFELKKPINCLASESKTNQHHYYIHISALSLKNMHAIPDLLNSIQHFQLTTKR